MTDSSRGHQQFFAELKRRHVFRVAAIYGAVAFGVLQVAEPLATALGLSDSFLSLVVGLLLLGFPVALVLAWAFEVTPEGVQKAESAAPGEIEAIIAQPAAKRWSAGLLALAGAALLFGGWWMGTQTASETGDVVQANLISGLQLVDLSEDTRPSIAVLPFADMSSTQDQEYFGDGMSEAILNVLAQTGDMRISGRTSAFAYKGEGKDLREIGAELGVAYIVEGSVAKEGDQVRVTAQLITAEDGTHLWSDQYLRPLTSIFEIQSEISAEIADALQVPLGLEGASDLVTPTQDLETYDLYLAGRARLRERGQGTVDAAKLFEAAIALDSAWAPAWAGLADAMELQLWNPTGEMPFDQTLMEAERIARRALELQPQNATALVVLGNIHRDRYEWADAEASYRRALGVDPDSPEAHQQYGELLHKMGRLQEAVRSMDRAAALDPAAVRLAQLMYVLWRDDRWDETDAVRRWTRTQGIDMTFGGESPDGDEFWRSTRAWEEGRYEEVDIPSGWGFGVYDSATWTAAIPALRAGRFAMLPDSLKGFDWGFADLIRFGELERAVADFLERRQAGQASASNIVRLSPEEIWWPALDPIRSHPDIQSYMESIGLGGRTVERTPVDERVRPTILRQAEAAAAKEPSAP